METPVLNNPELTFEKVWLMFQEMSKETNNKFQETDKKFRQTDRKFQEIQNELGGIGKSNGAIAEEFFFSGLSNTMKVGNFEFEYIDRNLKRKLKKNGLEAQYDIILYNKYKVLIVEVKYNFKEKFLRDFYEGGLKKFRTLFPQYQKYKIYGAIAGMTFEDNVIQEAENYGFFVLSQNNENIKIMNSGSFEPNEIR